MKQTLVAYPGTFFYGKILHFEDFSRKEQLMPLISRVENLVLFDRWQYYLCHVAN